MKRNEIAAQKEREVYEFLVSYTQSYLYPPTVEEIVKGTQSFTSTSTVYSILTRLEEQGLISITRGTPRGIKLLNYELSKKGDM